LWPLDELERIAGSLNQAQVCVVRNDADAAGDLAEQAAEKIAAACWISDHGCGRESRATWP
jgi:hypothetical protein